MRDFRKSLAERRQRVPGLHFLGIFFMLVGAFLLVMALVNEKHPDDRISLAAVSVLMMIGGAVTTAVLLNHKPTSEVLKLAQSRNGLLTLSEIATALDIEPALALRTLKHLRKLGVATQRWEELRKNLWEFPDYVQLPISQTLDLAKTHGGRVSLRDLVASGHSLDIASQTFDTLSEKGLAQQDPASGERTLIVQSQ
jgi:hypothetical protein